jgi:hypothetical protein
MKYINTYKLFEGVKPNNKFYTTDEILNINDILLDISDTLPIEYRIVTSGITKKGYTVDNLFLDWGDSSVSKQNEYKNHQDMTIEFTFKINRNNSNFWPDNFIDVMSRVMESMDDSSTYLYRVYSSFEDTVEDICGDNNKEEFLGDLRDTIYRIDPFEQIDIEIMKKNKFTRIYTQN